MSLEKRMRELDESAKKINAREFLFGQVPTNYDDIGRLGKTFAPFADLWKVACGWIENKVANLLWVKG